MSEQRRKRTRKTSNPDVRSLQARQESPNLQAETKSMPQQESEVVAETDTENTKQIGGKMRESFLDRIREHKTPIIQAIVVVAIAVIVSALMIPALAPGKGAYNAAITGLQADMAQASASINTLGTNLNTRMDTLEGDTEGFASRINANSDDIGTLQGWKDLTDPRITVLESQNSPPEGYLTGNLGNYTLYAKCNEAGNFTANVHLVYVPAVTVGNTTYEDALTTFYGSINWTAPAVKAYVPTLTYNSTAWQVSQTWFNIGTFALTANNETAIDIIFSGLGSAYNATFSYVEVWPILNG